MARRGSRYLPASALLAVDCAGDLRAKSPVAWMGPRSLSKYELRMSRTKPHRVVPIPLASLRDHPRQCELFREPSDAEIAELAENIKARGLIHPIHVLSDLTIVQGHRRVAAARRLGWSTIPATVRTDLDGDPEAIEIALI